MSDEQDTVRASTDTDSLLELAWNIIANVDAPEVGWPHQNHEWREATIRFRDGYHEWLREGYPVVGIDNVQAKEATKAIAIIQNMFHSLETVNTRVDKLRELVDVQGAHGNWNSEEYMRGMYNGMQLMLATMEDRLPKYRARPKEGYILDSKPEHMPGNEQVAPSVHDEGEDVKDGD